MPFVLSPMIPTNSPGMWGEGDAYLKKCIYSIDKVLPPVNYDEHTIRPHSLTHLETPAHTKKEGQRLDFYYSKKIKHFYGQTLVLKVPDEGYVSLGNGIFHKTITLEEINLRLRELNLPKLPSKILITTKTYPLNVEGFHDPNHVLTLSKEAAQFLIEQIDIDLYGTSWKSSDFNPGKPERPIHNILFEKALILENLDLLRVPEGIYFMSAFPIPFIGASESPVVPVLFEYDEINSHS